MDKGSNYIFYCISNSPYASSYYNSESLLFYQTDIRCVALYITSHCLRELTPQFSSQCACERVHACFVLNILVIVNDV